MIEIILTSSALILVLVILRRVLRGRIDPRVQYALWLLVAARLLIPGTLFTAPVSVLGATEGLQTALHETFPNPDSLPEPVINDIKNQLDHLPPAQPAIPVSIEHPDKDTVVTTYDITAMPEITQRVYNWPDIIWKTGIAVVGSAILLSNLAFHLRLRRNRKLLTLPAAPWSGNLPVYEAENLPSPCLFGLFRPTIYLNGAAMAAKHPEHILAHEYAHYRHGDHLWSILRSICLVIHWYNPLVWVAAALSRRDCELACDASALKRLGEEERIDYGQTLLGMVSRNRNTAALLHTATTMTAGKRAMTERIALIIRQPKTKRITMLLVILTMCLLAACTFGGKAEEPDQTDDPTDAADEASPLLEYPGLHWNDSVETVMEALGVTEEDFIESGEDTTGHSNTFYFAIGDVPLYGHTAQYVICQFVQHIGTGSGLGLWQVRVSFPDDMEDFGAVREELLRQYGPEAENSDSVRKIDSSWKNLLGDRYDHWVELQQQSGINYTHWIAAPDAQTEETRQLLASVEENYQTYAAKYNGLPSFEEFSRDFSWAELIWNSNSLWAPTFNTVYFDGSGYVQILQMFTTPVQTRNAGIVINYVRQGTDPSEWLSYMNYMDWADIRQAAVDAGFDTGDGSAFALDVLKTISLYVEQQELTLNEGSYMYILTATEGLDGTLIEAYSYLLCQLHDINPGLFAHTVLETLPEEERGTILDYYRYYVSDREEPLSREETIAQLEYEMAISLSASPGEMVLTRQGKSFQFLPENAYGVYAATYSSSNPTVAGVTQNGTVTSLNAGEAYITMHYEGAQGQHDFVCHVTCDFSGGSETSAESIRSYVQAGISPSEWLPMLERTSWKEIAHTEDNSRDWIMDVQEAIYSYVLDSGSGTPLTDAEILTLLTSTKGLDGAYSEGYAGILYALYSLDPARFAIIALDRLSPEQRDEALGMLLYDWGYYHQLDENLSYQERLQILLEQLKEDQKMNLRLSPDTLILSYAGAVGQFRIVNEEAAMSYSLESSNPEVASVEVNGSDIFSVTAVSPGETTITVHCTIGGEERELTCSVLCYW